jgi:molybdate transport system substrate-binding protein
MTSPRRRGLASTALLLGAVAASCGGASPEPPAPSADEPRLEGSITVFAAASLTDVFTELAETFEAREPGVTVRLDLGASSSLREQILAGAPADVFAAADERNVTAVVDAG